jgi:hypothetical protein
MVEPERAALLLGDRILKVNEQGGDKVEAIAAMRTAIVSSRWRLALLRGVRCCVVVRS